MVRGTVRKDRSCTIGPAKTERGPPSLIAASTSGVLTTTKINADRTVSHAFTSPATRPEGGKVRRLMTPCIGIGTRPRPVLGGLLLPARLSGVSIHRRFAPGRFGGFDAGIRRRGLRCRRLRRCRLDIDHATRPAEIVRPSARRRDSMTRAQPNGRPRIFGRSS